MITHEDDTERLRVVRRYDILDTPPDGSFDRITAIAARLFKVPISIISIVDHDRIWFKSHHGLDTTQVGRDPGLCASAILKDGPHIIPDARLDVHALTNPLIAGNFGLRFYAGVPLRTHDGFNLGTLCIIDKEPRELSAENIETLRDLASVVMDQLELRISAKNSLDTKEQLLKEINHRIGNSLQLVSNSLTIQGIESDGVGRHFEEAAERVARIGRVHHRLSGTGTLETVDFKKYLIELSEDIAHSLLSGNRAHELIVESDEATLSSEMATSLGLIVNELVTNSAKYAYPDGQPGSIVVRFKVTDEQLELSVEDAGKGLPEDSDNTKYITGLGTKLIQSLVQNIEGELLVGTGSNGRGVCSRIILRK